uniref:Peptidase putative n=1 Tax=Albugo laibachii Nc14 TaxID=890382 RepID=F0WQ92_9STRA|nr:peptidase putative [Albugo laibachii Nc14]|eukprot:CCA23498.1 peptidase putative [Albugo laibachii Nc14]
MAFPVMLYIVLLHLIKPLTFLQGCTLIAAGPKATSDGSVLLAHTDDAGGGAADLRIVRVPSQDHSKGSKRAVYNFRSGYPRVVSRERGDHYAPIDSSQDLFEPMGYIPQIAHTLAYFDQDYGMMNEKQLSISESTCGAKTVGWPIDAGSHGRNLFGIAELTKVALERCVTARCAIETMGELAVEYGFYSEDSGSAAIPDYGDSAECLGIADASGEVWVFHVLTGLRNASAVWAAQRVPENHVTAIANGFTIRNLDLRNKDWYMASPNVYSVAEQLGWWRSDSVEPFDFTAAYGFADKDAIGPLYTGRRMWRIFDVFAPSLKLDARLGSFSHYVTYPFSVKPDKAVTLSEMMTLLRDYYGGTPYDMTKGIAAGPFGNPVRYGGKSHGVLGGWERPISMYRTMFSFVAQIQFNLPQCTSGVLWYGQGSPHGTVYVPFSCKQESLPQSYLLGKQSEFNLESAWWAFDFVNNWSQLRFNIINEDVQQRVNELQDEAFAMRNDLEQMHESDHCSVALLEDKSNEFAKYVVEEWWKFAFYLIGKYSDGYVTTGEEAQDMVDPGYPAWWLQVSEFSKWPGDSFLPRVTVDVSTVASNAIQVDRAELARGSSKLTHHWNKLFITCWIVLGALLGTASSILLLFIRRRRMGYTKLM